MLEHVGQALLTGSLGMAAGLGLGEGLGFGEGVGTGGGGAGGWHKPPLKDCPRGQQRPFWVAESKE